MIQKETNKKSYPQDVSMYKRRNRKYSRV